MAYGITTWRAHLDYAAGGWADPGEIDWTLLRIWGAQQDAFSPTLSFAGRYFHGAPTAEEAEAGTGFCLWAHGEAALADAPRAIIPIQRASREHQEQLGHGGLYYGAQDATAIAQYIDQCLAVGDLSCGSDKQFLVFLEVEEGSRLSPDYWLGWATTLRDAIIWPARRDARSTVEPLQPLLPALLCSFEYDATTFRFIPEKNVRDCLDVPPRHGFRTRCHGFWARRRAADATHDFDWTTIGEYRQPLEIVVSTTPYMARVPVRYLRVFEGPDGWDIPDDGTRETLSLVTIDVPPEENGTAIIEGTFTATDWSADRRVDGELAELPTQLGVDTGAGMPDESASCLSRKLMRATELPYHGGGTPVELTGPCAFAMLYYRPDGRRMSRAEAAALSRNGMAAAAIWQARATLTQGWAPYVEDLIEPFVNGRGFEHAVEAFKYAAKDIGQPPFTPIYFAIDFPVGDPGYTDGEPDSVPVATPSIGVILEYFRDVQRGYRKHLETYPTQRYYTGVYCHPDTAIALYRAGLATHFWAPPWGDGAPFPHLNLWQIGMFSSATVARDNSSLRSCAPTRSADFWVDIDVAWGDPGTFQVFE